MTAQEMLQILKGPRDGKVLLFNELSTRILSGDGLSDDEVPIFEALRKELTIVRTTVQMEASVTGVGGVKG